MHHNTYNKIFYSILLIALTVRIYIVFFAGLGWYECDTQMYFDMANGILHGKPISYFPNGYPLLLAGIVKLSASNAGLIAVLLNIIVQIASLIIIERILSNFKVRHAAILLIVILTAFYPNQVSRVRFIMTEPVSVFLILLSILFYIKNKFTLSGFTGWLAYSFRPSLLLVSPFIFIKDLWNKNYAKSLKNISGFFAGSLIFAALTYFGVTASQSTQNYNTLVALQSYGYNIRWDLNSFTEEEKKSPYITYIKFAVNNPVEYTKQRALSFFSLWGPIVPTEYGVIGMILHGIRFPFFISALLVFLFRKKLHYDQNLILLLSFPVISVTIIQTLFFSNQRHQFAAEPFVIILAVIGLMELRIIKALISRMSLLAQKVKVHYTLDGN